MSGKDEGARSAMETETGPPLTNAEEAKIEGQAPLRSPVLYRVISRQGEEEMRRPAGSLFWSGFAAGVGIYASVIAEGALHQKLPPMPGREVIADLGYSVGFLIVILGRMQLFTEQTIVPVLSIVRAPTLRNLGRLARLWGIVFAANMLGTLMVAGLTATGALASPELRHAMVEVSRSLLAGSPLDIMLQGIPAGFLIASIAWLLASTKGEHFFIVFIITYVIALGDFSHVIAGAAEAFLLAFSGEASFGWAIGNFIMPALIGNIIGGTGLFAMFAYGQVRQEL